MEWAHSVAGQHPLFHVGYDIANYFRSEVIAKKNGRLRGLWVKFLENGLSEDREILQTYRE